jgi:hypothetical protein
MKTVENGSMNLFWSSRHPAEAVCELEREQIISSDTSDTSKSISRRGLYVES